MATTWKIVERPGYLGKRKNERYEEWDEKYGKGNWRITWQDALGNSLTYEDIFEIYVKGYVEYFKAHPEEAQYLTGNYGYGYDIDLIPKDAAFDMYYLYGKPNFANQFHNVALNIALEEVLHLPFKGTTPIQVRGGKPGTDEKTWPSGWKWHPGLIPCPYPELIPHDVAHENKWWDKNSIEDLYQSAKVLEIKE